MRAPHFLLAAVVALATSLSLRAAAWHHFHGWSGHPGWHHRLPGDQWGHRFGRGSGPNGFDAPFAHDRPPRPAVGSRPPTGPTPLPDPAPADSAPASR